MTRQEQLDLIRAACIEANPGDTTLRDQHSWQGLQTKRKDGRPIRLADVLLAIDRQHKKSNGYVSYLVGSDGSFYEQEKLCGAHEASCDWNLRKDDLTEQSDECVAYLAHLLG